MTTPKVVSIPHAGSGPHAPRLTPAEAAHLQRATPLVPQQLKKS